MFRKWVKDLVLAESYIGLTYQEAILRKLAALKGSTWRLANSFEEAKGIDNMIGDVPVSIKPASYRSKPMLSEVISVRIVYYEKPNADSASSII